MFSKLCSCSVLIGLKEFDERPLCYCRLGTAKQASGALKACGAEFQWGARQPSGEVNGRLEEEDEGL